MNKIKQILKILLGKNFIKKLSYAKYLYKKYKGKRDNIPLIKCILKTKIIKEDEKIKQIDKLLQSVEIGKINENDKFYYHIDIFKKMYEENNNMGNLTIDYSKILNNSLEDYKLIVKDKCKDDEEFAKSKIELIQSIEKYIDRVTGKITDKNIANNLERIKNSKSESFYESLQRILFFNQLMWQSEYYLNGLGRLDIILEPYYKNDIENKVINEEEVKELIKEFLVKLHKDFYYKSNSLSGDTGQIIELGGTDLKGNYIYNELTYIFIDVVKELQLPDPKLLVRVSKATPRKLIEKSLECIATGIGCPLFANDDIIIEKLINFGYDRDDAYNYVTSACWEPFIAGKSLDQNNEQSIVFEKPLENMLEKEKLDDIKNINEVLDLYKIYLEEHIKEIVELLNNKKYAKSPLLTLFTDECLSNCIDISKGGAKYNNIGLTSVGLSNLVNALLNIEKLVFIEKKYTLYELNKAKQENFVYNSELITELKSGNKKFGKDDEKVIELANKVIKMTSSILVKYKNQFDGRYKFGLSAPSYIMASKDFPASLDGRKAKEPFAVHISSDSSNAYTELINFASKLDYSDDRFNGNVIDFFVTPNFIKDNFDKFVDLIMLSIKLGFFEMQMNVVSSKTLIEARKNPDKFPNLIVRVWGFSAYFVDLPDEYKDYLIERALRSENNSF